MSALLHPHQVRLLEQIEAAIEGGCRRLIAQAPTGFGKTICAAHRLRLVQDAGRRALFIVPALSLIDQSIKKLYAEGVRDVGVIQADHTMTNAARPIQVASVQTLQRRMMPDADEIIIDEVHRWYEFYPRLLADPRFADVPIIGLTATPWTRGLGRHFDRLVIGATTQRLIATNYLSRFRVFAPASPDLTGVRTVAGDFREDDLSRAMDKSALVADVVTTWLERGEERPTLCFAVDRAHAKHLQQEFQDADVTAGYIDAYTTAAERREIERQFHAGEIKVVCNVGCLTTGIDWDVRCIILARPTRSEILFVQMIGRGLRTADGKDDCLILDHSDNHIRLGFVTDIHHDRLDDGRERQNALPKEREALPKKCPECTFLKPPKMLICPCCGFKPEPQCKVENREGELVEMISRRVAKPAIYDTATRARWHAELAFIAAERGYKPGWASHKYREKFGSWPPTRYIVPIPPSSEVLSWVRSRNIAYAKRSTAA